MKHLLILAMTLLAVSSYGQSELPTGRIEVVKDFEVRLTETKNQDCSAACCCGFKYQKV